MTSLYIAVPCYGAAKAAFEGSMRKLDRSLAKVGIRHIPGGARLYGESLITRARNRMVSAFLRSDFEWFMFIDSDIVFESSDVLRLLHSGHDLCGAPYPAKAAGGRLIGNPRVVGGEAEFVDGWLRAQDLPTGFMLVHRRVFEALAPHVAEVDDDVPGSERASYRVFFDVGTDERQYLSEDWWFTRLATKAGFEPWLDARAKLGHVGDFEFRAPSFEEAIAGAAESDGRNGKRPPGMSVEKWLTDRGVTP